MAEEFRVPVAIPVETNASTAADSIEALRDSVTKSKDAIKESAAAMRDLRGKSDEVKAAKDQLTAKIRAEEAAVTKNTLALVKQGTSLEALAKKEKVAQDAAKAKADKEIKAAKAAEKAKADQVKNSADAMKGSSDAMSKALGAAGGPIASLKDKLSGLTEVLGGSEGGMAAVVGIAAMAAAALVAVGVAAVAATVALAKFVIVSADAARMMQLTRQANLNGNAAWAKNLGDQVDRIARSVPLAKDKINELGISLAKSRIGGQTMVDTLDAVSGATAAAGDDLGNKLKGIVERGAFTRRFQLSPQELLGMDLDFDEVAKAYATGMHVSVERARQELVSGRVKLADGAKALKNAVDAKFGEVNSAKMLGLDNQLARFKENLAGLTKDVNLDPLLKGIKSLADNFDQSSVNGKALKGILTTFGNALGMSFSGAVPLLQDFIDKAVYGALKLENYWLRAEVQFQKFTHGTKTLASALGEAFTKGIGDAGGGNWGILLDTWAEKGPQAAKNCRALVDAITGLKAQILGTDWAEVGSNVIDGIKNGLEAGAARLVDKVKGLADSVKKAFTSTLHIGSPSKDFYDYGKWTAKGAEGGIEAGTPAVHAAAAAMAPVPGEGARSGGALGGGRGPVSLTFAPVINLTGGGGDVADQLKDPNLLQALTDLFLGQVRAAGIEVPS